MISFKCYSLSLKFCFLFEDKIRIKSSNSVFMINRYWTFICSKPQLYNVLGATWTMDYPCSLQFSTFPSEVWLYGVTFLLTYNLTFDSKPSFNFSIFEISNFCLKIAKQCYLFTKLIIVLFELLPSLWQSSTSLLVNFNFCEFLYHQFNFSTELSITLF